MDSTSTFVIRSPEGVTRRVPVNDGRMTIGRTAEATIVLEHAMISRLHAELWRDQAGNYHVRDLGSRNYTFVNGEQVVERMLVAGDQIALGPFTITLETMDGSRQATRITLNDGPGARISRLQDHSPPRIDVAQLMRLNAFGHTLLQTPGKEERMAELCQLMVGPQLRGQWAVIVRMSNGDKDDVPQLLHEARGTAAGEPYLSRGVLRMVRESGDPVLASNMGLPVNQQANVEVSISPQITAMAAVACPIICSAGTLELLYVMLPPALGSGEWLALVNLAVQQYQQGEAAWAARMAAEAMAIVRQELSHARRIQMRLVPTKPQVAGLELAISYTPCHEVGGDYVDIVSMPDGRTLLTVADVCGKGLGAALVSSSLHTMVHSGVLSGLQLEPLMSLLNRYLCTILPEDSFVTMIALVIDPATGLGEMVNAGHPPPIVLSPIHAPRQLDGKGNFPLRCDEGDLVSQPVSLNQGEILALYTDGLSELHTEAGNMLGIEGLTAELNAIFGHMPSNLAEAATALSRRLMALTGKNPASDDLTFLLARRA